MIQNYAQVPKRIYTLEEMRLNKIEPTALLSPTDDTLNGVRTVLQARGAQPRHGSCPATPCRLAPCTLTLQDRRIVCRPAGRCSSRLCSVVLWGGTQQRAAGRSARGSGVHLLCGPGACVSLRQALAITPESCALHGCALVLYTFRWAGVLCNSSSALYRLPTAAGFRTWLWTAQRV